MSSFTEPVEPEREAAAPGWRSYHLFHHENCEQVVAGVVAPVAAALWGRGVLDRFFYLHFALGGPHVRFRVRCHSNDSLDQADRAVAQAAKELYRRFPSRRTLDEQTIRDVNRGILATDPLETDDRVYEDNTWHVAPFHAEVNRYGGAERFGESLDFFCLSSVEALADRWGSAETNRARKLARGFRILLRQAWGFARDERELRRLLGTVVEVWGDNFPGVVKKGDALFQQRKQELATLAFAELDALCSGTAPAGHPGEPGWIAEASHRLSSTLDGNDGPGVGIRRRVGASQLHMTANRLGFLNAEEVYLGRLIQLATDDLRRSEPAWWSRLDQGLQNKDVGPSGASLEQLVAPALDRLTALVGAPSAP